MLNLHLRGDLVSYNLLGVDVPTKVGRLAELSYCLYQYNCMHYSLPHYLCCSIRQYNLLSHTHPYLNFSHTSLWCSIYTWNYGFFPPGVRWGYKNHQRIFTAISLHEAFLGTMFDLLYQPILSKTQYLNDRKRLNTKSSVT